MNSVPAMIFIAFDGKKFFEAEDCTAYESAHWRLLLEGMTAEQVERALSREDVERANAIERAGRIIGKLRVDSGVRLRAPRNGGSSTASDGEKVTDDAEGASE